MQAMHQKFQMGMDYPLPVFVTADQEFPPHWHEAVEVIYALEDDLRVGINHEIHSLKARDILLVGGGLAFHGGIVLARPLLLFLARGRFGHRTVNVINELDQRSDDHKPNGGNNECAGA